MIVALIDNGSFEPAAHRNLRAVAAALSDRTGVQVRAISWQHSDRIAAAALDNTPAWTLKPFVRAMVALGQREFVFVPFFISAEGAIGSALRHDLEELRRQTGGFEFSFTDGLAARGVLPGIVADRVRDTIGECAGTFRAPPALILVDHGGPSPASAALRDRLAAEIGRELGGAIGPFAAASMEGAHPPLLADQLRLPGFADRDVVIAMLFLSPARHAGTDGDVAQICRAARPACPPEARQRWEPAEPVYPRCHLTALVGQHPAVVDVLADALRDTMAARRPRNGGAGGPVPERDLPAPFAAGESRPAPPFARLCPAIPAEAVRHVN